jgi:hypothetical protein
MEEEVEDEIGWGSGRYEYEVRFLLILFFIFKGKNKINMMKQRDFRYRVRQSWGKVEGRRRWEKDVLCFRDDVWKGVIISIN